MEAYEAVVGPVTVTCTTNEYSPEDVGFSFTCRFDAAVGTATVTRDALTVLPPGTELHLFAENYTTLETADGTILVEAVGEFLSADQTSYPLFLLQ